MPLIARRSINRPARLSWQNAPPYAETLKLGTLHAAFVRAEASERAAVVVATHRVNHYTGDAGARRAWRVPPVPKPMLVNLACWQNTVFETRG